MHLPPFLQLELRARKWRENKEDAVGLSRKEIVHYNFIWLNFSYTLFLEMFAPKWNFVWKNKFLLVSTKFSASYLYGKKSALEMGRL